jgi:hypothetical protein
MDNEQKYHFGKKYYSHVVRKDLSQAWYAPNTQWPNRNDLKIVKLPECYSFDLCRIQQEVQQLLDQYKTIHNQNADYSGLSLTARHGSPDPLGDWLIKKNHGDYIDALSDSKVFYNRQLPDIVETPYDIETAAMTQAFKGIMEKFKSPITKVSLVKLAAGGAIVPHVDFPYYQAIRLHASIFTNDNMFYDVGGERFTVPADGNFYLLNAGIYHGVINEGTTDRINLNINLKLDLEQLKTHGLGNMLALGLL